MQQPFEIGQEVVALKDSVHIEYFKKRVVYKVLDIKKCLCGRWNISVGFIEDFRQTCNCGNCLANKNQPAWHSAKYFAPVTRLRISDKLTIAEGLAKEPVEERADVLTEIINH